MDKWLDFGKKYRYLLLSTLLVILFLIGLFFSSNESEWPEDSLSIVESESKEESLDQIVVDIKGEIRKPGIYTLPSGARLYELIQLAGGVTGEGNEEVMNFAQELFDQQLIIVPHLDDPVAYSDDGVAGTTQQNQIDLNTADSSQLQELPGIGAKKAQAIIAYREEKGFFKTVEEVKEVSGIGEKTFEALEGLIVVR